MSDRIILNEKEITKEEFEKKRKQVEEMPDAQLVEVKKNEFKIRIKD